jgi:hypothetical protein
VSKLAGASTLIAGGGETIVFSLGNDFIDLGPVLDNAGTVALR